MFAAEIRRKRIDRRRAYSNWKWHLDEVFVKINGETHYLWRAVDHEGEVLESYVTKRRDRKAALKFLRKTMKRYGEPQIVVTDTRPEFARSLHEDCWTMSDIPTNSFLEYTLGATYAKTALPIIFVTGMSGLLAVVDALFLGHYVRLDALAAVTLMFPIYMLIVALATLVSSGLSSILARHLGANQMNDARAVFVRAHGLAFVVCAILILLFVLFGRMVATLAAGGSEDLAQMGLTYLRITVMFSPFLFVLSVNSDTLRNENRVGFMAVMSLLVSLANIGFNYVFIAKLDRGVAGTAYVTAMAQLLAFVMILSD